jgi:hypothetical protein
VNELATEGGRLPKSSISCLYIVVAPREVIADYQTAVKCPREIT